MVSLGFFVEVLSTPFACLAEKTGSAFGDVNQLAELAPAYTDYGVLVIADPEKAFSGEDAAAIRAVRRGVGARLLSSLGGSSGSCRPRTQRKK